MSDWDRVEASGPARAGVLWLHRFPPQEGGDDKRELTELQDAGDYFIPGMNASEMYLAAGEPQRLERYDANHAMHSDAARADRREFQLG